MPYSSKQLFWIKNILTCNAFFTATLKCCIFYELPALISNTVNISLYSTHIQKHFGILDNSLKCKEVLRPESLKTTVLYCLTIQPYYLFPPETCLLQI